MTMPDLLTLMFIVLGAGALAAIMLVFATCDALLSSHPYDQGGDSG
jgi:hypothetical protein